MVFSLLQPAADARQGVGAADVVVAVQRQDVRQGARGPLLQGERRHLFWDLKILFWNLMILFWDLKILFWDLKILFWDLKIQDFGT